MSSELDNIQLTPLLVGEWYKDNLLLSPDGPPAIQRPPKAPPQNQPQNQPQTAAVRTPEVPAASRAPEPLPAPEGPPVYKFLGKNGKKITILVQSPGIPFLPDNQLGFLTKILEACRLTLGDVAIVNNSTGPVNITALKQQLQPAAVLLFGIEPTAIKLPINFPEFKVQPYDNCSYLSAPPLAKLVEQSEESRLLKSKLWLCLKTLFNV